MDAFCPFLRISPFAAVYIFACRDGFPDLHVFVGGPVGEPFPVVAGVVCHRVLPGTCTIEPEYGLAAFFLDCQNGKRASDNAFCVIVRSGENHIAVHFPSPFLAHYIFTSRRNNHSCCYNFSGTYVRKVSCVKCNLVGGRGFTLRSQIHGTGNCCDHHCRRCE